MRASCVVGVLVVLVVACSSTSSKVLPQDAGGGGGTGGGLAGAAGSGASGTGGSAGTGVADSGVGDAAASDGATGADAGCGSNGQGLSGPCHQCLFAECSSEYDACLCAPACKAILDCMDNCAASEGGISSNCFKSCYTAGSSMGRAKYDDMTGCSKNVCSTTCPLFNAASTP